MRDFAQIVDRLQQDAELGEARAQFHLGVMYGLGLGVEQNFYKARRWYERAASAGVAEAQSNLGFIYGTGRGVPQDYVHAYAWYSIAASQGADAARRNRDHVAELMTPMQLERAQALSAELFEGIDSL